MGETVSEKGTIRIPRETFEKHNQRRQEIGLEWAEYIDGQAPSFELSEEDKQELINAIAATADGEGRVDNDSIAREVVTQLDYAQLANAVAEELEEKMNKY